MSYVVESASSRRARRRRRTAITLLVVVAMLVGAFYVASSYRNTPDAAAGASGCPPSSTTATATGKTTGTAKAKPVSKAPTPGQITVNVYNATSRSGLAGDTAKAVKARGFVVGKVSNDPLKKTLTSPGELRYGKSGAAAAAVAKGLLPSAKSVVDGRADASVDLVLGNAYTALAAPRPGAAAVTPGC